MDILNVETGKKEILPDDEIAPAIIMGSHAYPAGTHVRVKDPDGTLGTIPAEKVQAAFQAGYQPYGPRQDAIDTAVEENDNLKGTLKVAAEGAFDEALFGVPGLIQNHQQDDLERAKWEAIKADHDNANIVGRTVGLGANLYLGGPLFKAGAKAAMATEAALAARIGLAGAGAVTKRGAMTAAKAIASKMAGGAVEGAIITAPHAITEAMLGDPELAAEATMWGGGIGAVLGGGGAAAGELLGITSRGAKKGYEWLGGKAPTKENMIEVLGSHATGVPRSTIKEYLDNPEAIKAAEERTGIQITDDIDVASAKYKDQQAAAVDDFKVKDRDADQALKEAQADLRSNKPTLANADGIMMALEGVGAKLGGLSREVNDALENTYIISGRKKVPITWRKQDLKADITTAKKAWLKSEGAKGPIIDEHVKAWAKAEELIERIESGYPGKTLNALELRDLMRDIRSSNPGGYGLGAGEYGTHLTNAYKQIAETFSDRIKNKLNKNGFPEYDNFMKIMKPMRDNEEAMAGLFGTEKAALSSISRYASSGDPIIARHLSEFDAIHGTSFIKDLEKYRSAKRLLDESKLKDLRALIVPEQHLAAADAGKELDRIMAQNESIAYVLRNKIRPGAKLSKDSERALVELSRLEGHAQGVDDFATQMKYRRILDSFDAAHIQGSRRVNAFGATMGGLAGSIFGPGGAAIGAAVGGGLGYVADVDGGKILRRMIDGETMLGPQFIEKAMKSGGQKLDRITEVLGNMKKRATSDGTFRASAVDTARMDVIRAMVRDVIDPDERHNKDHIHSKVNEKLADWVSNPALMQEHVSSITSPLGKYGAPITATMSTQKLFKAVNYLHSVMPKPSRQPSPFAPPVLWKPSSFQIKGFEEKFEAVADPFSVLNHLENGTLTRNHMEAIKTVYPALHKVMQRRVFDAVSNEKVQLNYTDRLKLSLVMDMPLDSSMQNIARHQKTFLQPDPGAPEGGGKPMSVNIASQYSPESGRRGGRT